jgi:hypothetical protein
MSQPEASPPPISDTLLGVLRLIGALAVLVIATIAILAVLDVLPDEMLARLTMRIVVVAGSAAAAIGAATVLVPPRN